MSDLVDETLEYWSIDCAGVGGAADKNRRQCRKLEQRIKGAIKNMNSVLRNYSQRYCKEVDFSALMGEVQDACTCGQFEVTKRPADPARYLTVVNTTHRVRSELFERRI